MCVYARIDLLSLDCVEAENWVMPWEGQDPYFETLLDCLTASVVILYFDFCATLEFEIGIEFFLVLVVLVLFFLLK